MGITFSEDQQKVIDLRNRNILVSAAAGSGKTTVMVERIIQMICDKEKPVDIDRLLVVTFTNAAAASMREKISNAIAKKIEEEPGNEHLERQATLLHNAQITTIDSFCLFLIRNNFNDIGLDPNFRVADAGEIKLLQADAMDAFFEKSFAEDEDGSFKALAERFSGGNSLKACKEVIMEIFTHAMSRPFPKEWLSERCNDYCVGKGGVDSFEWVTAIKENAKRTMERCLAVTLENIELCNEPTGPYPYLKNLLEEKASMEQYVNCSTYQEWQRFMSTIQFNTLSSKKDEAISQEARELVKAKRNEVKSAISNLTKNYFFYQEETILDYMKKNGRVLERLCKAVLDYMDIFQGMKQEKKLVDFSDMEHYALDILVEKKDGEYVPTKAALDYRNYFQEIMIDEYQDSNMVQEFLLQTISGEQDGNYNRFMVGDVKQSIYKFRLACPEIFMEKYDTYAKEESNIQRIDLSQNYRSRQEVLDSVNYIFYRIMGKDMGNVSYDKDSALYPGAVYPEAEKNETELMLLEKTKNWKSTAIQEIYMVASKIKKMVHNHMVTDEKTGTLRPAEYKDMVILFRSAKGWDEDWRRILEEEGIPVSVITRTGYFSTKEIRTIMNFLRILDNPKQDIPLFGVMNSYIGGFNENELAYIKLTGKKSLYGNLKAYAQLEEDYIEDIRKKANAFLDMLQRYRNMVSYEPIHKLLRLFLQETGYLYHLAAMPGGEQRCANVEMFLEKAEKYEQSSFTGLFQFIRYMEQIKKYDVDFGEAATLDENANVVKIMTIHKSKGLEFPICFLVGMSKRMQARDTYGTILCDSEYGIALDYVDLEKRVKYPDFRKSVLARKMKQDEWGEQLRILYVAMTRAKEKLILSGVVDNLEKTVEKIKNYGNQNDPTKENVLLPLTIREDAGTYLDWILAAFANHSGIKQQLSDMGYDITVYAKPGPDMKIQFLHLEDILQKGIEILEEKTQRKREIEEKISYSEEEKERLEKQIYFSYPHKNLQKLYAKTSVSELKMAAMHAAYKDSEEEPAFSLYHDTEPEPVVPRFAKEEQKVSGAARGSAYHRVMELFDLTLIEQLLAIEKASAKLSDEARMLIKKEIDRQVESGRILREEADLVSVSKLYAFFVNPLAYRMAKAFEAGNLYKEKPFVLGIKADRLEKELPDTETVLIQGIIDAYFEEDGEIVLLDYKTDAVTTGEELIKRYETQIAYYTESIERITGLKVKEKILYSFALEEIVQV